MGDLEGAPTVHINFPLLSFYLWTTFETGIATPVSLFLRNKGGLVIACVTCHTKKKHFNLFVLDKFVDLVCVVSVINRAYPI